MRRFLTPSWLLRHAAMVGLVAAFLALGWWQVGRARGGNMLSYGYAIEWPVFALFVIFPEGGNFPPLRWTKAIERLHRLGLHAMARRARTMHNVLPPRPGGVLAALAAAPGADVMLVAHTGVDHLLTIADVWRELPMDKMIAMQWWLEPADAVPAGPDERVEWLYGWWARIDAWVAEHRPVELPRPRFTFAGRR